MRGRARSSNSGLNHGFAAGNGNCTRRQLNPMKAFVLATAVTLVASQAFAQGPRAESTVATPTGADLSAGVSSYTYREPGDQAIEIHAPKFVAELTGSFFLSK